MYVTKERERDLYFPREFHSTYNKLVLLDVFAILGCHVFIDHPVGIQSKQLINQDCRCDRS